MQIVQVGETVKFTPESQKDVYDLGRISVNPECKTQWVGTNIIDESSDELIGLDVNVNSLMDLIARPCISKIPCK